ncbi:hypothetical protein [Brucella pituitosa]|uniref:hypothetical protein n=1 Tax=Brucella pituitosa TaxID=571256 RepID=UPI0012603E0F|nr:hypothetical protein [Brucella pituitosa]
MNILGSQAPDVLGSIIVLLVLLTVSSIFTLWVLRKSLNENGDDETRRAYEDVLFACGSLMPYYLPYSLVDNIAKETDGQDNEKAN